MLEASPFEDKVKSSFWMIIFIYISIFINSYVFFTSPFEFYIGYLIYIVLLPIFFAKFGVQRNLFYIFLILLLSGLTNVLLGNNTVALFFKVFTGLTLSYFFYFYVVKEFKFNFTRLMEWYMIGAYIVSLIGIVQFVSFLVGFVPGYDYHWIFNKWGVITGGNFGIRVNAVFAEPTYYAATLSPAFFISLYNLFAKTHFYLNRINSLIVIGVYLLSFSGLGQVGVFLSITILALNYGLVRYVVVVIVVVIVLFNILYNNVREFKERYDGTVSLFSGEEFQLGRTHGSSFILYNNYVVTKKSFNSNFLFGTGVGSHPVSFDKYSIARSIKVSGFNQNSADANSMLLRLISETGLFGVLLFFFVIVKGYVIRKEHTNTNHWLISNALLIMILLNLLRQGHYFLNGFPFFVIVYYYNGVSYRNYLETGKGLFESITGEKE